MNKILLVGNFGHGWDGSICDEEHIAKALSEIAEIDVIRVQRDKVHEFVGIKEPIAFTLIFQWDGYNMEDIVNLPGPLVYWAFDYQADGQSWHNSLVDVCDLYLSKRIADSKYPNWHWLSQDFYPDFLDKVDSTEKDIDVLFTGSYLPWATERTELIKAIDEKYNLTVHSVTPNEWKEQGIKNSLGPIMDEGLPELYARAKVNISIDHTIEAGYWSDRNSQIMACGGMVLCRYVPMMESSFHQGVIYFYNIEECLELIEYLLQDEPYRNEVANHGYNIAHANFTVINRVADMLNIVMGIL